MGKPLRKQPLSSEQPFGDKSPQPHTDSAATEEGNTSEKDSKVASTMPDFKFSFGSSSSTTPAFSFSALVKSSDDAAPKPMFSFGQAPAISSFKFDFSKTATDAGPLKPADENSNDTEGAEPSVKASVQPPSVVDEKDYRSKDSVFEGNNVIYYTFDKEGKTWVQMSSGYMQIIRTSPDDTDCSKYQIVFSRQGTNAIAINALVTADIKIDKMKARLLSMTLANAIGSSKKEAQFTSYLFKFNTGDLRDKCYNVIRPSLEKAENDKDSSKVAVKTDAPADAQGLTDIS